MSFKCSVFGHRYGDPEVQREREEQGSEVVITIEEIETCKRCGETRVVSENKEVTTLETPSDIVGDDLADEDDGETDTPASAGETTGDQPAEMPDPPAGGDDAELIDEAEAGGVDPPGGSTTHAGEATADAGGRQTDAGEPATGAPAEGAVDDSTPDSDQDDAVILEEDADADEDREPGAWPDEGDSDDDGVEEWAPSTDSELRPVEEEQPDVEPTSSAVTVPEGIFHCPECGFRTDVESSSLRAGDFCPECHRGSLEHRSDGE
jgi:hypothetical protein